MARRKKASASRSHPQQTVYTSDDVLRLSCINLNVTIALILGDVTPLVAKSWEGQEVLNVIRKYLVDV